IGRKAEGAFPPGAGYFRSHGTRKGASFRDAGGGRIWRGGMEGRRRSDRPFIFRPASKCARLNGSTCEAREGTARRAGRNGRAIKCCVLEGRLTEAAKIEPGRGLHGNVVPRIAVIAIVTILLAACDRFPSDPEQS